MAFNNLLDQKAIMCLTSLTATEKLVAVAALSFRNSDTGFCAPPIETQDTDDQTGDKSPKDLVQATSLTRTCIKKTLRALEEKGVIRLTRRNARPSAIEFLETGNTATVNDVTGNNADGNHVTGNDVTGNDVTVTGNHVTGEEILPVTTLPLPVTTLPLPVTTLPQTNNKQINNKEEAPCFGLTSESEDKPKRETAKRLASQLVKPEGVSDALWGEWVAHKKKVCRACTQRMVNLLVREAEKAGMTPAEAMETQLDHGWKGFDASYVTDRTGRKPQPEPKYDSAFCVKPQPAHVATPFPDDDDPEVLNAIRRHFA